MTVDVKEIKPCHRADDPGRSFPETITIAVSILTATAIGLSAAPPKTRVNPKDGLTYVFIPPAKFTMGCSYEDSECVVNDRPRHSVTITTGFWMGQTEVTQDAYQRVMGSNPKLFSSNPANFKGPNLPVNFVNWAEASAYCTALGMRLPTEAEWEYAARGGVDMSRYGENWDVAWFEDDSDKRIHEVGQKKPNDYGLYDMLGNVAEWVFDWYQDNYDPKPAINPQGAATGNFRVTRGGSFSSNARSIRLSSRYRFAPDSGFYDIGFRCAGR